MRLTPVVNVKNFIHRNLYRTSVKIFIKYAYSGLNNAERCFIKFTAGVLQRFENKKFPTALHYVVW